MQYQGSSSKSNDEIWLRKVRCRVRNGGAMHCCHRHSEMNRFYSPYTIMSRATKTSEQPKSLKHICIQYQKHTALPTHPRKFVSTAVKKTTLFHPRAKYYMLCFIGDEGLVVSLSTSTSFRSRNGHIGVPFDDVLLISAVVAGT